MINRGKQSVLGVGISVVDYEGATAQIVEAAAARRPLTVTALAVHGVMTGALDREHNFRLNHLDVVCPDGQPVRWALRLLYGEKLPDRVYGPNLTLRVCQQCAERGLPVFLFGGTEEMLQALQNQLMTQFPELKIAGVQPSRFRQLEPAERDQLAKQINDSGARVCFVGLGCPRQETFVFEMRERIQMPTLAVGAAFAFHAGILAQAPPWMQRYGLEWLYRLIREPKRLWRRYLYLNPLFVTLLIGQYLGLYSGKTDRGDEPGEDLLFG